MPLLTITQYCRYRFVHRVRVSTFTLSLDQQRVANYSPKSDSEVLFFRFTSCCCNSCKRRHCCSAAIWAPLYKNWVLDHYQLRQLNWGLLHQKTKSITTFSSIVALSHIFFSFLYVHAYFEPPELKDAATKQQKLISKGPFLTYLGFLVHGMLLGLNSTTFPVFFVGHQISYIL